MVTKARALGKDFDIGSAVAVKDLDGGAQTGKNIYMGDCEGVTFVVFKGIGTTDDLALDLQEIEAVAGTPRDLEIITEYFTKSATTVLVGTEVWVKTTQSAASEITAIADSAEKEMILAFDVRADQLSDGYEYLTVNTPDLGSAAAQWGGVLAIKWGLKVQRAPENLPAFTR